MSQKTISENLFEKFCNQNGIKWEPIKTAPEEGKKTSDYFIYPSNQKVIAEVKQIDRNAEELERERKIKRRELNVRTSTPGKRVGKKIRDAYPQLKSISEDKYPCLLILYNNVPHSFDLLDSYNIKIGMYGLEQITFAVPRNPNRTPYIADKSFGSKRSLTTRDQNTTLSALAVIYEPSENNLSLDIYHNVHAKIKLRPEYLNGLKVKYFTLEEKEPGVFQDWVEM